ncbi:hypothetical protein IT398_01490 [Candidatus Nomurabacteria bacterium]|nr:hypothetical protein [Candidatus Nomurabacteria bacterium]
MKIEKFAWLFVILMMLISVGCSMSNSGENNTLALQGYRDIEIEQVAIAVPTRYDPEKQGETIRLGLERMIDRSQLWLRDGSPKAIAQTIGEAKERIPVIPAPPSQVPSAQKAMRVAVSSLN